MTGKIFLNYRRGDDAGTVGRLFDRLEPALGRGTIFMDVEGHIKAGDDYVDVLRAQVAQCDVLIAVIGPRWLTITDETGRRRLDNPEDWVRVEVVSALEAGAKKRVIPVLVPGGEMPRAEDLPEPLKPLARKQAVRITLERFNADAQGLVGQVKGVLEDLAQQRAASAAERAAAEAAQKQREVDEAARIGVLESVAHAQRAAGMSPDDVRKAEELANWDFIKTRADIDELRDHLARFPGGVTERYAQARLGELTFQGLSAEVPAESLKSFVEAFPKSEHAATVRQWLAAAETKARAEIEAAELHAKETADWAAVAASTDKAEINAFLSRWPGGAHATDAKARLSELRSSSGFNRRGILKGIGYSVGGAAAAYLTLVPGQPIWRLLNDKSMRTFTGHNNRISSVVFAPDGKTALSGGWDLKLWDVDAGQELRSFDSSNTRSIAFAPDGKTALSGTWDKTLMLWDAATGKAMRTFTGHSDWVNSVAFAPDGKSALSASDDKTLKLWDLATGQELRTFAGHEKRVASVAFAPDGKSALSGSWDDTLKLWDVATGQELRTFAGSGSVTSVALAPDGMTALSGSWDDTLKLWDVATGGELRTFSGHGDDVTSVAFAPDGKTALSASDDKTLKLWDLNTGRELRTFTGHSGVVTSVAFAPDGKTALSGSEDHTVKMWDLTR